jgi:hypothetical protein
MTPLWACDMSAWNAAAGEGHITQPWLCRAWGCEARWCRGPRIVPVADNYDRLGYRAEAVTRETRCTRYVDAAHMLRSHSSAMVPPALRQLAGEPGGDVLLACPGIVYRRDAIDWQHTGTPHQLDLWRITRRAVSDTDLDEMIAVLLGALTPGLPRRQQPRTHPYTLHGRQVDVHRDGRWVEVWEWGLAHPGARGSRAVWTVPPPEADPHDARLELARRYLHIYATANSRSSLGKRRRSWAVPTVRDEEPTGQIRPPRPRNGSQSA